MCRMALPITLLFALQGIPSPCSAAPDSADTPPPSESEVRLFVNYSAKPDPHTVLAHNLCILDPAADVPLALGRAMGHTHLAYVSVVEVAPDTPAAASAQKRGIPFLAKNAGWNSDVLDVNHPTWEEWLVEDVAKPALERGYDGIFLDTLDSVELLAAKRPGEAAASHRALVNAIRRLHREFPGKSIVLNRGFPLIDEVHDCIQGVLIEGLYQTWSPEKKTYSATPAKGSDWLLAHIGRIEAKKLPVYVVDYVPPSDKALAHRTAERIREAGAIPFVTTPELQGEELAPLREVPRRIAVLHGWKNADDSRPAFPADTLTSELLQAPLEWLGCEVDFFDAGKGLPPNLSPLRYRGILLDEELHLPLEQEDAFADWLLTQQRHGVKILFSGAIPFTREHVVRRVFTALGISGDNLPARLERAPTIVTQDAQMMNGETPVQPSTAEYRSLIAPRGSKVMLTLQGQDVNGRTLRFDPIFLAPWGGALLRPYILLRGLPDQTFCHVDIYSYLEAWLHDGQSFPAPDTTTRDGMRLFYSHIDGDGFVSRSALAGNPLCGEAIRDQILKKYPFPVTVSVVEAEIEAQMSGLDPNAVSRYREAARSVFALPNVQPASHTYSHPFRWLDPDPSDETKYPTRNLVLKPWTNYTEDISMDREVRGSIEYINRVLLPPDKKVDMLLWSGNCRPGAEAIRLCDEMGVENMNGGTTIMSRLYPGIAGVAPRHTFWDGSMQIFAANQNEFMYANGWLGPFFGGFANVVDTFERTGAPRRLKPVNAYYHFYSATYLSSMRALEKILDWSMEQPLHAVTARQYAQMVRDAWATRLFELEPGHWLISNGGHLRTFRLPASSDDPDMAASRGVTGWHREGGALYVHTRGTPVTEIMVKPSSGSHLRLVQSSAEIEFRVLSPLKAEFSVSDLRPVRATFAGVPAGRVCEMLVNGQTMRLTSDEQGRITLNLPSTADVTLDFTAEKYALRN